MCITMEAYDYPGTLGLYCYVMNGKTIGFAGMKIDGKYHLSDYLVDRLRAQFKVEPTIEFDSPQAIKSYLHALYMKEMN